MILLRNGGLALAFLTVLFTVFSGGFVLANTPHEAHLATDTGPAAPAPDSANNADEAPPVPDSPQATPQSPEAAALRARLAALPTEGSAEELKERVAVSDFYAARKDTPLWFTASGPSEQAAAIVAEIGRAGDWGLDAADFALPQLAPGAALEPAAAADAEVTLALAVLKYARFARGGRIIDPTTLLNSNLDRKPQLLDPQTVIAAAAAAPAADAYLRSLHPQHEQFEKLRQAWLIQRDRPQGKRILANMEMWRWMKEDLGEVHIFANVPEFMVRVVRAGATIHEERIVVGELGKQTSIFTRNLKTIVFRPLWRVPESIKVRELWPNLRRGGGLFRAHDLQLETKDGQPLDYRSIDWSTADIRDYEVVQQPGRRNVMGVVKFTFPSQHTIFMHDTIDKWMFASKQRMTSHGCLRLRNPMRMAEVVLAEDKGWDAERVQASMREGPANNEIVIEKKIPMHLVYFTARVDETGALRLYPDVYGHERRIRLALEGRWSEIDIGRDHLAPVQPGEDVSSFSSPVAARSRRNREPSVADIVGNALGGGF